MPILRYTYYAKGVRGYIIKTFKIENLYFLEIWIALITITM